jgi:alkanesulfonate monooxygenase SsuD/methylene tetrahydromethanopterin reductase-like flavin-dependent oxidoreductase (luciferase family)
MTALKHGVWLHNGTSLSIGDAVEAATVAEASGWDGVFVSDSPWEGYSDPWVTLGACAAVTERVTLGTWVIPLPQYDPMRVAHAAASVDQLSGGRMLLGVGLGVRDEYEMFHRGYDGPRLGRKYDEALQVVDGLWQNENFSFEGEFFRLQDAALPKRPVQSPRIPIVMGAWWPNRGPFRRAAAWDGVMPFWPALLGSEGPEGQEPSGATPDGELREMMAFYRSLTDDPGEVILPRSERLGPVIDPAAAEVGATWLLTLDATSLDAIGNGPPRQQMRESG